MANCTYSDVLMIINTDVSNTDITALITLADQEITDRGLSARDNVKTISMLLTAELVAMRQPFPVQSIGNAKHRGPAEYRQMAERLIHDGSIAFTAFEEPID